MGLLAAAPGSESLGHSIPIVSQWLRQGQVTIILRMRSVCLTFSDFVPLACWIPLRYLTCNPLLRFSETSDEGTEGGLNNCYCVKASLGH